MKYVQSPNCNFCQEDETISHMFWKCQESQAVIRQFIGCFNNKNINLTFIEELFVFNIGNSYSAADLQIFITMKHYIYTAKRLNKHSSIVQIMFYFWSFEIMEYILRTQKLSYV